MRPRGRRGGRPKALSPERLAQAQKLYDDGQMTVKQIAAEVSVSEAALYPHSPPKKARGQETERA